MNVNINLPQSEFAILKKMAKALGWDLFVQQEDNHINMLQRNELVKKLKLVYSVPKES